MTYQEALQKIHSLDAFGSRPGLDRIKRFLSILGNPQDSLKFIHVAGTNGKGSTCAMISSILKEEGYNTGLFISPYITEFCERIQLNNRPVAKDILAKKVEKTFPLLLKLQQENCIITEFEYVMALSFLIFKEAKCDVVVLEVGLGGLLDCTNVILPPLATIITTIGIDHTNILGNSIEEIATQKCGIIKQCSPVVTTVQEEKAMAIIEKVSKKNNCKLYKSEDVVLDITNKNIQGTEFIYKGANISLPLVGEHQIQNAKTALATIEALKEILPVSIDSICSGLAKASNPARFEVLNKNPLVILDGAHNPNGIESLKNAIEGLVPTKNNICILGMLADKDSQSSIELLAKIFNTVITVPVNNPRALTSQQLADKCREHFKEVLCFEDIFSAYDKGIDLAKEQHVSLIICGSLYLAGEIRPYIIKSANIRQKNN